MRSFKAQGKFTDMRDISSRLSAELQRLEHRPTSTEMPQGVGIVRFLVRCPYETSEVLAKAKEALKIVDKATLAGWPANGDLIPRLPQWFLSACAEEMSPDQATQWLSWWKSLPPEEQSKAEIEKDWSLDNWLYWMEPRNRQWFWWDAKVLEDYDHIALAIEVECWPFPWGSLRWLFRAAGAAAVEAEE
jgi:hypothetical protein